MTRPLADWNDVQRQRAAADSDSIRGGRPVSINEYMKIVRAGRQFIDRAMQNSKRHCLHAVDLREAAYQRVQKPWGGFTVDAHTGTPIPENYKGDTYAVTARLPDMSQVTVPINADRKAFDTAYNQAIKTYERVLDSEGGHLGIFHNQDTQRIEFDPVYHIEDVATTEAVGAYTHAVGGAYHFGSGYGHWMPHVVDEGLTQWVRDMAKRA